MGGRTMGGIVGSIIGFLGGPLGVLPALVLNAVGIHISGGLIGDLLGIGPKRPKPDTTVSSVKTSRPERVSAYGRSKLYGAYILYEVAAVSAHSGLKSSSGGDIAVDVYAVHDGELDAVEIRYLNDEVVTVSGSVVNEGTDGRYKGGVVHFYVTDGSAPGGGIPVLEDVLPGVWSTAHRGDGVVLMCVSANSVKAEDFQKVYPQSAVPIPSIVARWQHCPDPTAPDPLDESGWTWTENPVRHLLHYKLVREGPKPPLAKDAPGYAAELAALRSAWWAARIEPTLDYWIAAAADCDSGRALLAGGTEPKYRSCVVHKHTDEHAGPIADILATFDGWLSPRSDGALILYSGKYYDPTVAIGPSEILSFTWDGGDVDEAEAVNEVICSFISSEHSYNSVEGDAWRDEADISRRGKILSTTLDAQVPSIGQSRFLAKRLMARKNAKHRGTVVTNIAGRIAQGERFVDLHLEEAGAVFYSGPVEITSLTRNLKGGVTFTWVAADPEIDSWNPATEEGNTPPAGPSYPPGTLDPPTIDDFSTLYDGTGLRISLRALGPGRGDLTWYTRARAVGATEWGPDERYTAADTGTAGEAALTSGAIVVDTSVEIQTGYTVGSGDFSGWSDSAVIDTSTSAVAPGDPTDFSGVATADDVNDYAELTWRNPSTTNFAYVKVYRDTDATFAGAIQVGGDRYGGIGAVDTFTQIRPSGSWYYWVQAFTTTGVASNLIGPVEVVI